MPIVDGKALATARKKKKWSQLELSEATKPQINVSTISRIERGKSKVQRRVLNELCRALDVRQTDLAPRQEPERDVVKFRIESAARNALALVARRYRVPRERIVECAPLLFYIVAEQSLGKRREVLSAYRDAADYVYAAAIPHLPPSMQTVDVVASDLEERSIEERDLFGLELESCDFDPDYDAAEDNPFAAFLTKRLAEHQQSDAKVSWQDPTYSPSYTICTVEAAELVGGDTDATNAILRGTAPLHEMKGGSPAERAEWARDRDYRAFNVNVPDEVLAKIDL
jgi:transcriptional regulator with XRE-family HTH domain